MLFDERSREQHAQTLQPLIREVLPVAGHHTVGTGSARHLDKHRVRGVGQLHRSERFRQYGFSVCFDELQHGVDPLTGKCEASARQDLSVLDEDTLVEA